MSEQLAPRPYSDRELTLRAISLTFQRARAAQLALRDDSTGGNEAELAMPLVDDGLAAIDEAGAITTSEPGGDGGLDRPTGDEDNSIGGLDEPEDVDLPNPIVTDANLRHYMEQAVVHQGNPEDEAGKGRIETLRASAISRSNQARYNAAIVNALHQLDHRTRLQQQTITNLEAELADARRALAALESEQEEGR